MKKSPDEGRTKSELYDIPPITIFEKTRWRTASSSGTFATRRANSIILIICAHKGSCEAGTSWENSLVASMRLSHSATFILCSICSPGSFWGSFGGMKTFSTTKRKFAESSAERMGMTVDDEKRG